MAEQEFRVVITVVDQKRDVNGRMQKSEFGENLTVRNCKNLALGVLKLGLYGEKCKEGKRISSTKTRRNLAL